MLPTALFSKKLIALALLLTGSAFAEPVVVANNDFNNSKGAVSIKSVFSANQLKDEDGDNIKIGILKFDSSGKADIEKVFGKRQSRLFKKKFKRLEFDGRGSYPDEFETYQKLAQWVAETPNAVAIVDEQYIDESKMKVIEI